MENDLNKINTRPEKPKWYFKTSTLIVSFFFGLGPFILPLVWWNPYFSRTKKMVFTILILVLTFLLFKLSAYALDSLLKKLQLLQP